MNKTDMDTNHMIMDDDGYTWYWNGSRIFALDQETDYDCGDFYAPHGEPGYKANTWAEAVQWLVTDGYISKEQSLIEIEKG